MKFKYPYALINLFFFAISFMALLNPVRVHAGPMIVYVDTNSPAAEPTGHSWETAYTSIQDAIDASDPWYMIWVADGVYHEQIYLGEADRLYGGFEGYDGAEETQLSQRNWEKNVTTIDGNIPSESKGSEKVKTLVVIPRTVRMDGSTTCTLDGFTITGGSAYGSYPNNMGGGIYCLDSGNSNTIVNCVIKDNVAYYGAGVAFVNSSPQLENCIISDNEARSEGGGIYLEQDSRPTFTNCSIGNNICKSEGGGVYSDSSSTTFTNCLIFNNEAYLSGGAGVFFSHSYLGFINCAISGNSADFNGGIFAGSFDQLKIVNTIFHHNSDVALVPDVSNFILSNCLFYDNPGSAIGNEDFGFYDDEEVDNINADIPGAEDNITGDPRFVDWAGGNLRIMVCSAAVDKGTGNGAPDTDRDGNPRPVDISGQGDDATGQEYDIGAYEAQNMRRIDVSPSPLEVEQLVNQGAIVKPVIIANIGTEPIQFTSISLSGSPDFSFVETPDLSDLATCAKREALISFDPSRSGDITGTLTIESNDPENPEINLILLGTGTNTRPIAGQYHTGAALNFLDVNDRVIIPNFNNFPTIAMTVEFWMKSSSSNGCIISYATPPPGSNNEFYIYGQESLKIAINTTELNTGVAVNDDEWHHVAVTWQNATGQIRLYVDKTMAYEGALRQGYSIQGNGTLVFTEEQDAVGGSFDPYQAYIGWLDDVHIWSVIKLEDQIYGSMHKELYGNEIGLVGYWNFNNIRNSFVEDTSGDGNNGTIQGSPYWITPSPVDIVDDNATVGANVDSDTVFTLSGFDQDGDETSATVTLLPGAGQLYQYDNGSRGAAINSTPTGVSDSENRMIYAPSAPGMKVFTPYVLNYIVNDGFQNSANTAFLIWDFSDREINVTGGAHNFGLGLIGEPLPPPHMITISNDGSTTLTFYGNEVILSGTNPKDFLISSDTGESALAAGQSRTVGIRFTPQSKGLKTSQLLISSDDLDESAVEVSFLGFGDTRPITGKATAGAALDFVKPEDRVIITNIDKLSTDSLTVSCWLKSQASGDGIISYAIPGRDNEILLYDQGNFAFFIDNKSISTGVAFNDNAWHHLAVTWQSLDGRFNVYKDGDLASTGTLAAGSSLVNGGALVFAEDQDMMGGGFQASQAYIGALDEVRIWNKVRTQEEIQEDMSLELVGDESGLIGYWKLNEGSGTITSDATSNNKNGALSGLPAWIHSFAMKGIKSNFHIFAPNDEDTTITLFGIDADWDPLKAIITIIPAEEKGELYQLAGPVPVRGAKITTISTEVSDPDMRLVFAPNSTSNGFTAIIGWRVNDSLVNSNNTGNYAITVNADRLVLNFLLGKTTLLPLQREVLDLNDDGIVDIADVVTYYLLN